MNSPPLRVQTACGRERTNIEVSSSSKTMVRHIVNIAKYFCERFLLCKGRKVLDDLLPALSFLKTAPFIRWKHALSAEPFQRTFEFLAEWLGWFLSRGSHTHYSRFCHSFFFLLYHIPVFMFKNAEHFQGRRGDSYTQCQKTLT